MEAIMSDFKMFHASANRIPVIRRSALGLSQYQHFTYLRDDTPTPLDTIDFESWSGSIDIVVRTHTPIVYGNQDAINHTIALPSTPQGEIYMAPTMIKGLISSAYEKVTSSRLRIFGDHSKPLTYRMDPAESTHLVPVRIHNDGTTTKAIPLYGSTKTKDHITRPNGTEIPILFTATLLNMEAGGIRFRAGSGINQKRLVDLTKPTDTSVPYREIMFDARLVDNGAYAHWLITALYANRGKQIERIELFDYTKSNLIFVPGESLDMITGYVYATTTTEDRQWGKSTFTIKTANGIETAKKISERVFFAKPDINNDEGIDVPDDVINRYLLIIDSYIQEYREAKVKRVANRFIKEPDLGSRIRTEGALAYAVIDEADKRNPVLDTLVPISIGRTSYKCSPYDIARANYSSPAETAVEASPADRLFGYVARPRDREGDGDQSPCDALRGRVLFGLIDTSKVKMDTGVVPIRPLLSPRPSSARRYLTRAFGREAGENVNTPERPIKRSQYYSDDPQQALGACVFPTDRSALSRRNNLGFPIKALRLPEDSDNVSTTIHSWIAPGSELRTTIRFEGLTRSELSILLWLLQPENLSPESDSDSVRTDDGNLAEQNIGFFQIGMGKPLGLGLVTIEIPDDGFRAVRTEFPAENREADSLVHDYMSLTGCLGVSITTTSISSFPPPHKFTSSPWVRAFQRSCFGYTDNHPVRHMSLTENRHNNMTEANGDNAGYPKEGAGVEPKSLWTSDGGDPIRVAKQ